MNSEQNIALRNGIVLLPMVWCSTIALVVAISLCIFRHEMRHNREALIAYANRFLMEAMQRSSLAIDSSDPKDLQDGVPDDDQWEDIVPLVDEMVVAHDNRRRRQLAQRSRSVERPADSPSSGRHKSLVHYLHGFILAAKLKLKQQICSTYNRPRPTILGVLIELCRLPVYVWAYVFMTGVQVLFETVLAVGRYTYSICLFVKNSVY